MMEIGNDVPPTTESVGREKNNQKSNRERGDSFGQPQPCSKDEYALDNSLREV